jgi:hypothetical protein
MNPEQHQLLTLSMLPARLSAEQAGQFLGFQAHELTILMAAGLLRPLGRPAANSPKYFAAVELEQLRRDAKWLSRATDAVQHRWRQKNRTERATRPRANDRQRFVERNLADAGQAVA